MPKYSLETIANWLKIELDGKQNLDISSLAAIEQANDSQLSFLSNPKYEKHLYESNAAAVLVKKDFEASRAVKPVLLKVDDPYLAFAILLHRFYIPEEINEAIHPNASIAETAIVETAVKIGAYTIIKDQVRVGANSQIFDQVYLGANVTIGKDCIIYPGVKIYRDCHVGNGTIIHSGTVIGSDGFGFAPQSNTYQKIPQTGNVIIGSKVEIGANCAIDRATVGSTIIEDGVK
ncbi:UNVERIFIED_CONTAM: hypothetical protein GTU68_029709, partial [Idotea baltica]|nr:hypothetical protein [Idotea baltica]